MPAETFARMGVSIMTWSDGMEDTVDENELLSTTLA